MTSGVVFSSDDKTQRESSFLLGASTVRGCLSDVCFFDVDYHMKLMEKVTVLQYGGQIMTTPRKKSLQIGRNSCSIASEDVSN